MKLFVYGTLQPGEPLSAWLRDAWFEPPQRATTPGTLYHVTGGSDERPIYPVALIGPEEALDGPRVAGTVLDLVDDHPAVRRTIRMEEGAGYEAVPVVCTLFDGTKVEAIGFRYRHEPAGPPIEGGDWLKVAHVGEDEDEWDCGAGGRL